MKKKHKKSNALKKILAKGALGCAPFAILFFLSIFLVAGVMSFFFCGSFSEKFSASENSELVEAAKAKSNEISASFKDYYGTDKRFSLGYNYILAYTKYYTSNEQYSANKVPSTPLDVKNLINSTGEKLRPLIQYKEDKVTTVREYKVKVKKFTEDSLPDNIGIIDREPDKKTLVYRKTYCIENDKTYIKDEDKIEVVDGKPDELIDYRIYTRKESGVVAENFNVGDKIFIFENNQVLRVIEEEETRTETKEENIFIVVSAITISGAYDVQYEVKVEVKQKDDEKLTITKPVIKGMKQTDKKWDYLKRLIAKDFPNDDVDNARDIIIATALSYTTDKITEDMIYSGSGGSVSPEDFTGGQAEFIDKIAPGAVKAYEKYHVLPSITIAQGILESGWGKSELTQKANNLFGIKAFGWNGATIDMLTREVDENGSEYYVVASFRAYNSWDDCIEDHTQILLQPNFTGVIGAKSYQEAAEALKAGGYATDPAYAQLLISLIETYSLYKYDS